MPLFGPPNVEKLKEKRDVKALAKTLRDKTPIFREKAAMALRDLHDPGSADALAAAINDEYWGVRWLTVAALADLGDPRGIERLPAAVEELHQHAHLLGGEEGQRRYLGNVPVELLISVLKSSIRNWRERGITEAAVWTLGMLGDPRAVDPLIIVLKEHKPLKGTFRTDPDPGGAAATALTRLGGAAVKPLIDALRESVSVSSTQAMQVTSAVSPVLGNLGVVAVGPVVGLLKDENPRVRTVARAVLRHMGRVAVAPLMAALQDHEEAIRCSAAAVLGKLNDARAVAPLVTALKDRSFDVRKAAAEALERVGGPEAKRALAEYRSRQT